MSETTGPQRHIRLFGATAIGVGAIVGGGILALAGVAFEASGPGALLAFALNGLIAALTALSFAELSTAFPQSGGAYVFAKRVLSVGTAFLVGWIVWFASIVAAVLYAIGFASFALEGLDAGLSAAGVATPAGLHAPLALALTAALATLFCALLIARSPAGGGNAVSVAKVLVFVVLIGGGVRFWLGEGATGTFTPFLPRGAGGLLSAMGFSFIALQGFDLIAAVAGEIHEPRRTIPRAMFLALGIALAVYLPLLAVVIAVGVPAGTTLGERVAANPDTFIAEAARAYLGTTGYWLVIVAGVLSMISALLANVYAASRIAQAMGRDRTLPSRVERTHASLGTPVWATGLTLAIALAILVAVGDVASAGAASSLIFLLAFALAHVLCIVVRRRRPQHGGFRVPLWPWLPAAGALACIALAVFQGLAVPAAGRVVGAWLALGVLFYLAVFARRARIRDAVHEVKDAELLELRGQSPLVLVPVAGGSDPSVLALLGACLSPPRVGRVLMLNVVSTLRSAGDEHFEDELDRSSRLLRDSLSAAVRAGARTESLATLADEPLTEIERVAREHRCATLLLGMTQLSDSALRGRLEQLASDLRCNLVIARIPPGWSAFGVKRALVPVRGGAHGVLRARLLSSLHHRAAPDLEVDYLLVLPEKATARTHRRRERAWAEELREDADIPSTVRSVASSDVAAAIVEEARCCDLLILGLSRPTHQSRAFGSIMRRIIASTECAVLVISER